MVRTGDEPPSCTDLMGILNQLWWLLGVVMAVPLMLPGVEHVLTGSYQWGVLFLALGLIALFLPEYIRWRLLGGNSPFDRVPLIGTRTDQGEE